MSSEMPDNVRNMVVSVGTFDRPHESLRKEDNACCAVAGIEMKFSALILESETSSFGPPPPFSIEQYLIKRTVSPN
jgi:hypothetical protein